MTLQTPRLILRGWQEEDLPALIEGINDIAVSQWLAAVPCPYTMNDAQEFLRMCGQAAAQQPRTNYFWAITLKSTGEVIGGVSLNGIHFGHGTAEGGIWTNTRFHGHGYGTEAFDARIRFAFEQLGLRRIESGFFAGNDASLRMQKRLGFEVEGMRRKGFMCRADGQYKDEYTTGLLREEWRPYY